jgi:type IV pilus assembly protein PilB
MKFYHEDIEKAFNQIIEENLRKLQKTGKKEVSAEKAALELPIIKIVDTIIEYGYENHASDIHIEPYEDREVIRFRIDGVLHDVLDLPKNIHDLVVTRLKIMAKLRTDEHRAAQDGRIEVRLKAEKLDIRVSIVPITEGEKVVMRLLAERTRRYSLEDLGFSPADYKKVKSAASKPYGMILATGPTGSGKTTTLYSILKGLNKREVNIATIEDPVEYEMEGVNQIQVNSRTNLTFAKGLRSIVRQDPDIIMVGEIRDVETAAIAVNAAMTGHLVLSTLHTNDAPTTLPRLLDMEVESFLVASTVNVVVGQRLVRLICKRCIESYTLKGEKLAIIKKELDFEKLLNKKGINQLRLYRGKGCKYCNDSGYSGRIGIFEVMMISEKIKAMIMERKNSDEIKVQAISEGMTTVIGDGLQKALTGITTVEEVLRVSRM